MAYGYHGGYSVSDNIHYCPACGAAISTTHGDGSATCTECGLRFAVIQKCKERRIPTQTIKALTILDPWAHFFILNTDGKPIMPGVASEPIKQYETRSWKTDYRGPIAIHVSKRILEDKTIFADLHHALFPGKQYDGSWLYFNQFGNAPGHERGCIIAIAELTDIYRTSGSKVFNVWENKRASFYPTSREVAVGDWSPFRYAWKLTDVRPIVPIPAKGKQGLWNWTVPEGVTFK